MIITLPWPDRRLSPNARLHWRARIEPKQTAKGVARYSTVAAEGWLETVDRLSANDKAIPVTMRFYPPDKRKRDDDNAIGSMKAARDAIADALGVDDSRFKVTYEFCEPEKPGRVEVEI